MYCQHGRQWCQQLKLKKNHKFLILDDQKNKKPFQRMRLTSNTPVGGDVQRRGQPAVCNFSSSADCSLYSTLIPECTAAYQPIGKHSKVDDY